MTIAPPNGLLAELTHRCPLACPYCSNPLELVQQQSELATDTWARVFNEAAQLGVLHVHLSGGEPASRRDLEDLVRAAHQAGLYTNLITSGIGLTEARLAALADAGLDHLQLSLQDVDAASSDRIGDYRGFARKRDVARWTRARGLALTLNAPLHRANVQNTQRFIDLAVEMDAGRIELAHVQYYGWALANRAALLPTRDQVMETMAIAALAREALKGRLVIDMVVPDYHADVPKPCMGGWGREVMVIAPDGRAMPCHAAAGIAGMSFENVTTSALADIWTNSAAFNRFRGTDWMQEPCRSCANAPVDFGGCRCQALALTGDASATDPACALSSHHAMMRQIGADEAQASPPPYRFRRMNLI